LVQLEPEGVVVLGLDRERTGLVDLLFLALLGRLGLGLVLDAEAVEDEVRAPGVRRRGEAFPRVHEVLCGDLIAVVELCPLLESEGVGGEVVRHLIVRGQ